MEEPESAIEFYVFPIADIVRQFVNAMIPREGATILDYDYFLDTAKGQAVISLVIRREESEQPAPPR